MPARTARIIVTIGPATSSEQHLRAMKAKGVDFVRANMSHSSLEDLEFLIGLSKRVGLPFIIDTEGSQIRTGDLVDDTVYFKENEKVIIHGTPLVGGPRELCLRPGSVIQQLEPGDLVHIDFDTLILRVSDVSTVSRGFVAAYAITGGHVGRNKAVVIDPALDKSWNLPALSRKDLQSVRIGLREGIEHIAVSFVRTADAVDEVRHATQNRMKIISKLECVDALCHLDGIIMNSDAVLIDRGDLSKEIPIERIPFTQKIIIDRANRHGKEAYVATNLLESMVAQRKPTRAEVHDVINTIVDGAKGLTLAAETAIGKFPMECINMLDKLIKHAEQVVSSTHTDYAGPRVRSEALESSGYLVNRDDSSSLIAPHGGRLVHRMAADASVAADTDSRACVPLDMNAQMDVEQIAMGTYSPLEGFMGRDDLHSVLDRMRLTSGVVWPIPILLDVDRRYANDLSIGEEVNLIDDNGHVMAILHLSEKYDFDETLREQIADKVLGTTSSLHPGVRMTREMRPVLLAGKIDLIRRRNATTKQYELTPRQLRRLFDERGWTTVLAFHTRNVIHRAHEFVQLKAMEDELCDGMLVHPVIGKKKRGDYNATYTIRAYERMVESFYPKNKVVFAAFSTYPRYAGPREALFTALCRQNFGCSHFIVGRNHTSVGDFYSPTAAHEIFDEFPELLVKPVRYNEVFYSKKRGQYVVSDSASADQHDSDKLSISGTEARAIFERGETPPSWFMRQEIADIILEAIRDGEQVFVENE